MGDISNEDVLGSMSYEDALGKDFAGIPEEDFDLLEDSSPQFNLAFEFDGLHWRVSRYDLLRVLDVVYQYPSHSTSYLVFSLKKKQASGKDVFYLHILSTNVDYVFSRDLLLLNQDSVYETDSPFVLKGDAILILARAYSDFVFSFDDENNIFFQNKYVKHQFDLLRVDLQGLVTPIPEGDFSPLKFNLPALQSIKFLFKSAIRVIDNKVFVAGKTIHGFFSIFSFLFTFEDSFPADFSLRKTDVFVLESLLKGVTSSDFECLVGDSRFWLFFDGGYLSFLTDTAFYEQSSVVFGDPQGELSLDFSLFKKALNVCKALSVRAVSFEEDGGNISLIGGKAIRFVIGSGSLVDSFSVPLESFSNLISAVVCADEVLNISVFVGGMRIKSSFDGVEYQYDISKVSAKQFERGINDDAKKQERESLGYSNNSFSDSMKEDSGGSLLDSLKGQDL